MRVYCDVGEIPCQVEFVGMTDEVQSVSSHVRGRRGAMDTYRVVKATWPLYQQAIEAARQKRALDQASVTPNSGDVGGVDAGQQKREPHNGAKAVRLGDSVHSQAPPASSDSDPRKFSEQWAEDACDAIDAGFFTGDSFRSNEALARMEWYMGRWHREMARIRESLATESSDD